MIEEKEPLFNAGIDYVQTIRELFKMYHAGRAQGMDVRDMLWIPENICTEIGPRITGEEKILFKKKIMKAVILPEHKNLRDAMDYASELVHAHKLIMPDKPTTEDTFRSI